MPSTLPRLAGLAAALLLTACGATSTTAPAEPDAPSATSTPDAAVTVYPDFNALWNYSDPAGTEAVFRARLADEPPATLDERLQLETQIARTLGLQRDFDGAHALLDTIEPQLDDTTPVARVRYLLERGRALRSGGDAPASIPLFVEAWDLARDAGYDGYAVDAAHMVGIAETGEASLEWNLTAIEYAEQSEQDEGQRWLGSLYNNTGWSLHDLERYDEALDLFERALVFREGTGNTTTIRIAKWCVGRVLRSLERYDEALAIQQALHDEYAADGEPSGYVFEELGELHLVMGDGDAAAPFFAEAYGVLSQDPWLMSNEADRIARLAELGGVDVDAATEGGDDGAPADD